MPIDPSIALQYKPMELPDPLERATKQQNLLTSQAQLKESEYKLQKLQSDEARLNQFYQSVAANGGPKNGLEIEDAMFKSGIPAAVDKALQLRSTRLQIESERQRISNIMGNQMPTGTPAANESLTLPTASTAPTTKFPTGMSLQDYTAGLATPSPYYQGANQLAANVTPTTTTAPVANAPVANALTPTVAPTPAPVVNALAAPVAGAPNISELRRRRDLLLQDGSPQALELAKSIDKDIALLSKITTGAPGAAVLDAAGNVIRTIPAASTPTTLSKLIKERDALPPNDPLRPLYNATITKQATHAPGASVVMPAQEKEFEKELGSGQAKAILTSRTAAQDAAQILQTNQIGRDILKSGAITGAGADFFVGLNQALKTAGVDAGRADAAANSQAYVAAMASNTGKLIKQYGAGTGLSDADRDYAAAAAGGKIAMDEKAIRKVLDINDRAARNVINDHNKKVKGIKTNIPLTVEMPSTGGGNGGFTYLGKESK